MSDAFFFLIRSHDPMQILHYTPSYNQAVNYTLSYNPLRHDDNDDDDEG
jgi:hypothetical protein